MDEINYFEAPKSFETPRSAASSASERRIATLLLEARQKGYSLGLYYRWQIKGYLILTIAFGPGIVFWSWLQFWPEVNLMAGVLVGVLLRDFGIARAQVRMWKTQKRLLDWDKVEHMAAGNPLD